MTGRILIIEDNPANLELMEYVLRAFDYRLQTAVNGQKGLEIALRDPFDLIICDLQMPVMDGYELASRLKAERKTRQIPLVAVTALAMVGDKEKALAAGFDGYITKPIDPENFVRQVQEFLREKRRAIAEVLPIFPSQGDTPSVYRYKILVVDNSPVNLELAKSLFEPHGYQTLTASGIDEALQIARSHFPDLILSDIAMNGETGYDLIRLVRADPALCAIPFVFLTSTMMSQQDCEKGLALGAARFLTRPIEPDKLLAEIESCLAQARSVPWPKS